MVLMLCFHVNKKRCALRADNHKVDDRMESHGQSDLVSTFAEFACHGRIEPPIGSDVQTAIPFGPA